MDNASGSIAAVMRHCPELTLKCNFAQANSWGKILKNRHCPHGQWTEGQHWRSRRYLRNRPKNDWNQKTIGSKNLCFYACGPHERICKRRWYTRTQYAKCWIWRKFSIIKDWSETCFLCIFGQGFRFRGQIGDPEPPRGEKSGIFVFFTPENGVFSPKMLI